MDTRLEVKEAGRVTVPQYNLREVKFPFRSVFFVGSNTGVERHFPDLREHGLSFQT